LLESIGLSAVYGFSILVALVGLGLASIAMQGPSASKLTAVPSKRAVTKHVPVVPAAFHGEIAEAGTLAETGSGTRPRQLVTTLKSAEAAGIAFENLRVATTDRLLRFGQSVIAFVPLKGNKHAKELTDLLQKQSGTILDTGAPLTWLQFDLQFSVSNDKGRGTQQDLQTYFALPPDVRPAPPWRPDTALPPEKRDAQRKACSTYVRILELEEATAQDAELQRLLVSRPLRSLFSRKPTSDRWKEFRERRDQLTHSALTKLQTSGDANLDGRVIALALAQPADGFSRTQTEAIESWRAQLRELLTGSEEQDAGGDDVSGSFIASGNRITVHSMTFQNPEKTLPALAKYLVESGATEIRYGFYNAEVFEPTRINALEK